MLKETICVEKHLGPPKIRVWNMALLTYLYKTFKTQMQYKFLSLWAEVSFLFSLKFLYFLELKPSKFLNHLSCFCKILNLASRLGFSSKIASPLQSLSIWADFFKVRSYIERPIVLCCNLWMDITLELIIRHAKVFTF